MKEEKERDGRDRENGVFSALRRRITSLGSEMNRARDAREGLHLIPRYIAASRHRLSIPLPTDRQENIFIPARLLSSLFLSRSLALSLSRLSRTPAYAVRFCRGHSFVAAGEGARKTAGGP